MVEAISLCGLIDDWVLAVPVTMLNWASGALMWYFRQAGYFCEVSKMTVHVPGWPRPPQWLHHDLSRAWSQGFTLVGSPEVGWGWNMGEEEYLQAEVAKVLRKLIGKGTDLVTLLDTHAPAGCPFVQVGTIMLRSCVHSRLVHLMRNMYHDALLEALDEADSSISAALRRLWQWEGSFAPHQARQLMMALRDGGMGFRSLKQIAPFAFLAAWASVGPHVEETIPLSRGWRMRDLASRHGPAARQARSSAGRSSPQSQAFRAAVAAGEATINAKESTMRRVWGEGNFSKHPPVHR